MTRRKQRFIAVAFAVGVAAIAPTVAQAKMSPTAVNDRAHFGNVQEHQLGAGEIPYLSQGRGVNPAAFGGSVSTPAQQPRVAIPYLSQGVGVTSAELFGAAPDDRTFARATVDPAPVVVTKSDGWSIDINGSTAVGLALMLGLLAGGTLVGIRNVRRTRLSAA